MRRLAHPLSLLNQCGRYITAGFPQNLEHISIYCLGDVLDVMKSKSASTCYNSWNGGNYCTNNFGAVFLFRNHFYTYPSQSPKWIIRIEYPSVVFRRHLPVISGLSPGECISLPHYGFQIILPQVQFLPQLCDMHIDRPCLNRRCDMPSGWQQKIPRTDMPGMVEQRKE